MRIVAPDWQRSQASITKADIGWEVLLFISPPGAGSNTPARLTKERRLPSRRLKHTAVWRPPLLERRSVQFLDSHIADVGRDGSPSRPKNKAKLGTPWQCVPTTFRRSQELSLTFVRPIAGNYGV